MPRVPAPPQLRALGLSKRYGRVAAVDGLDLEVGPGQCLALLGPNGAGKSTTLLMLAGVLSPDAGTIRIAGHDNPMLARVRRRVGFVPQSIALYPELSADENLRLFAHIHGVPSWRIEERVEYALQLAELCDRRHQRLATFSGGMQRRLNVAAATLHEPDVLLLDEPTVGVDPHSRAHLFDSIERLKAEGIGIVYSTHYMAEAEQLSERIAIMDRGRLLAQGTRRALIDEYAKGFEVTVELAERSRRPGTGHLALAPAPIRFEVQRAGEIVRRLTALGGEIRNLSVSQPDLESVFLRLTGRRLRD